MRQTLAKKQNCIKTKLYQLNNLYTKKKDYTAIIKMSKKTSIQNAQNTQNMQKPQVCLGLIKVTFNSPKAGFPAQGSSSFQPSHRCQRYLQIEKVLAN